MEGCHANYLAFLFGLSLSLSLLSWAVGESYHHTLYLPPSLIQSQLIPLSTGQACLECRGKRTQKDGWTDGLVPVPVSISVSRIQYG